MSKDVFVFAEQRDGEIQKVSFELVGRARGLADDLGQKVVAVLLGHEMKEKAQALIHHGADEVIVIDNPILKEYITEPYAKAVTAVIKTGTRKYFCLALLLLAGI